MEKTEDCGGCENCTPENPGCPWNGECFIDNPVTKNKENKMSELMDVYKVIKTTPEGKMVSAAVGHKIVTYEPGVEAKPRRWCGPLTAFTDIYAAIGFIGTLPEENRPLCAVFSAKAKPTKMKMVWRPAEGTGIVEGKDISELPKKTVLCKSITLTSPVFP